MIITDTNEMENISYRFHLFDKKSFQNHSLFLLIENMIQSVYDAARNNLPTMKNQLKLTVKLIKRTV